MSKKVFGFLSALCVLSAIASQSFGLEQVTYFHNDYLGSPVLLSNDAARTITNEGYQPFGKRLNNQALSKDNQQWFTGRNQDPDTGLVYMNARYYHPNLGRFMAVDPVSFFENNPMSFNRYLYVNNNPYKYTDPNGEVLDTVLDVGFLLYDIGALVYDEVANGGENRTTNLLALGADGAAIFVPFATGAGPAVRTARAVDNVVAAAKGVCCFVAGTQILTEDGYKNIEDIEIGDFVLSKNVDTGEQGWKPVTTLFEKYRVIYQLDVFDASGRLESVFTTDDHPFYVVGKGFVETLYLNVGDLIETEDGGWVTVQSVVNTEYQKPTYNIEVADFHTYYATKFGLLVHNICGWSPASNLNQLWSKGKLGEHFVEKGAQFGAKNAKEYGEMALEFATRKNKGGLTDFVNGSFSYRFDPVTKTILVGSKKGKIKTFYKWDPDKFPDDDVIKMLREAGLF